MTTYQYQLSNGTWTDAADARASEFIAAAVTKAVEMTTRFNGALPAKVAFLGPIIDTASAIAALAAGRALPIADGAFDKIRAKPVTPIVAAAVAAPVASTAAAASGARRIELLATATRKNLAHGKSWVCSEQQVERGDAHPSFEGEVVCYVYAS